MKLRVNYKLPVSSICECVCVRHAVWIGAEKNESKYLTTRYLSSKPDVVVFLPTNNLKKNLHILYPTPSFFIKELFIRTLELMPKMEVMPEGRLRVTCSSRVSTGGIGVFLLKKLSVFLTAKRTLPSGKLYLHFDITLSTREIVPF